MDQLEPPTRRSVILSTDAVGYSRLMAGDARETVRTLKERLATIGRVVDEHGGRVVNAVGDNLLAEFPSAQAAVRCAATVQPTLEHDNLALAQERRMPFRIGIHLGEVIVEGDLIYGDSVNIAARLEGLAQPGGVCLSRDVLEELDEADDLHCEDAGERVLKNIPEPIRLFRLLLGTERDLEHGRERPALGSRPGLAVLPFESRSADSEQGYFADGLAEELIARLSRLSSVRVISRNSSFSFRDRGVQDPDQIGKALGVRYLVEGSVRRAGSRVRLSAWLTDLTRRQQIWSNKYDRELSDIFDVQDDVSQAIVVSMHPELLRSETARAVRKAPANLDTWELILRAGWLLNRYSKDDTRRARESLERALELDPDSVGAHYSLALCHHFDVMNGWCEDPKHAIDELLRLARRSVALDATRPEGQLTLGIAYVLTDQNELALAAIKYASQLDPNSTQAHAWLGGMLALRGSPEEALDHLEEAMRLSPRDPAMWLFLDDAAVASFAGRRYRDAIDWAHRSLQHRGERPRPYAVIAASHGQLGEDAEAKLAATELVRLRPDFDPKRPGRLLTHTDPSFGARLVSGLERAGITS